MRFNRLLAATDLSAPARQAAERAALIARQSGAGLDLVHVANLAPLQKLSRLLAPLPAETEQHLLERTREALDELAADLLREHGVGAGVHVACGPLLDELTGLSDGLDADLLVFGAFGASFLRHLLLGSTAERLVGRSRRPMLVVKQPARTHYRRVLLPVDFSASSVRAIDLARAVAPAAELVLLHALDIPYDGLLSSAGVDKETLEYYRTAAQQEARQKMQALREQSGVQIDETRLLILTGDPALSIIEQEQALDCDLIAIGKHGESTLEDFLIGSVTRFALMRSRGDVLVAV